MKIELIGFLTKFAALVFGGAACGVLFVIAICILCQSENDGQGFFRSRK